MKLEQTVRPSVNNHCPNNMEQVMRVTTAPDVQLRINLDDVIEHELAEYAP